MKRLCAETWLSSPPRSHTQSPRATTLRLGRRRARTSRALHVHRNTLGYRLNRIEQLAGLDLARPRDVACVYLALAAEQRAP